MRSDGTVPRDAWVKNLAKAVQARRKQLDLTQLELSALAGCGPVFIYDLENGTKATLRLDKLLDVLTVLGLQLSLEPGQERLRVSEELA